MLPAHVTHFGVYNSLLAGSNVATANKVFVISAGSNVGMRVIFFSECYVQKTSYASWTINKQASEHHG